MKTVGQLKAEIRSQVWAEQEPENLVGAHDLQFQEAFAEVATKVRCEQEGNVNVTDFCKTFSKCGMTIVPEPPGIVGRVFTIVTRDGSEQWCDPVEYRRVDWPMPEFFGKRAMERMKTLPSFPTNFELGFHQADASQDCPFGRARYGIFAIHRGNIYLAPWIQSVEKVIVEWDGVKVLFADGDAINDTQLYKRCIRLYWQYLHEDAWGDAKRAQSIHDTVNRRGSYDEALADLMYECEERRKVRSTAVNPYDYPARCVLQPVIEEQGLPNKPPGPLILGHVGNFTAGNQPPAVAQIVKNYAVHAVLASAPGASGFEARAYDHLVGSNYHQYIEPYRGDFSGSLGVQQFFVWPGDPNGHVTTYSTAGAFCIDTVNNITWIKSDGVISNTGWH